MKKVGIMAAALVMCMSLGTALAVEEINLDTSDESLSNKLLYGGVNEKQTYYVSGYAEDIKSSGASVSVITRKDIEKQNSPSVVDLLHQQMGVTVQQSNGSPGSAATVRMRGTDRVRVTVDGLDVNRPSATASTFEPQHFLSDDIERIEVIRGAQGNVNGVNASGGVIAMQTRRGRGPLSVEAYSGMGNYGQFKERMAISGGDSKKDYYLGVTWYKTDGGMWTSQMGRIKNDDYNSLNVVANTGVRLLDEKADLRNVFRFSRSRKTLGIGYDNFTYEAYQAPNNYGLNFDIMDVVSWDHVVNDKYNYDARFGVYHNESDNFINEDNINSDPTYRSTSKISSTRLDFNTQHNYQIADWNTLSLGYNFDAEFIDGMGHDVGQEFNWWTYDYDKYDRDYGYSGHTIQNDVYINDLINIKDILFIRGGARLLTNSDYGTYVTPDVSAALVLPTFGIEGAKTKFRGSFGQSVNTPTLYQRFGKADFGWAKLVPNHDLKAEKMTGWDAGVEQSFFDDKLAFEFGWFHHDYKDYIGYFSDPITWNGSYKNIDDARSWGFETGARWEPNEKFKATVNYTYTFARDKHTNQNLPGNVYNRINGTLYWTPWERLTLFTGAEFGDGVHYYFGGGDVKEHTKTPSYVNVKVGGEVKLVKTENFDVSLQGTVYNLLNQKISLYKDSISNNYYAPGINFMAGIYAKYTLPERESKEKI